MTSAATVSEVERYDVATIVGGGAKLGTVTAVGVVIFALVSRPLDGFAETLIQSVLILAGGLVVSYAPGLLVRVRTIDGLGWTALLGLMGALFFTLFDVVLLRPFDIYHWTWDQIGGGSGFWYIPVWFMGSAFLATLGGMNISKAPNRELMVLGARTLIMSVVLFTVIAASGLFPPTSAVMALAFSLGLALDLVVTAVQSKG